MKHSFIYIFSLSTVLALSFAVFYIFKPYRYIDNATSQIICNKDGKSFELGWNFIYTFSDKLDYFNDAKARKLCEFEIIKDYNNTYKTPSQVNYRFEPKYIQESSWMDAIFMFFATFLIGILIIETLRFFLTTKFLHFTSFWQAEGASRILRKFVLLILICLLITPLIFIIVIKNPAAFIFCKRQVARKVNNFKRVIFKYGIFPIPEEDAHIKSLLPGLYQNCLKNEGIKK